VPGYSPTFLKNGANVRLVTQFLDVSVTADQSAEVAAATSVLQFANQLSQNDPGISYSLGLSLYLDNHPTGATRAWQQAGATGTARLGMLIAGLDDRFQGVCEIVFHAELSPTVLYMCGREYVRSGDYDVATAAFERSLELFDADHYHLPTGLITRAHLYADIGKAHYWQAALDQATQYLLVAEQLASQHDHALLSNIYAFLGMIYRRQGQLSASESYLLRAWSNSPSNFDTALSLGQLYSDLLDWEKAIQFFTSAGVARPEDPRSHLGLSRAYTELGDLRLAAEHAIIADELLLECEESAD